MDRGGQKLAVLLLIVMEDTRLIGDAPSDDLSLFSKGRTQNIYQNTVLFRSCPIERPVSSAQHNDPQPPIIFFRTSSSPQRSASVKTQAPPLLPPPSTATYTIGFVGRCSAPQIHEGAPQIWHHVGVPPPAQAQVRGKCYSHITGLRSGTMEVLLPLLW
jgi:hypothetical protein